MPGKIEVVEEYSQQDLDWFGAQQYFEENPNKKKCARTNINPYTGKSFLNSYLRDDNGNIFQLAGKADPGGLVGMGAFGRVKKATDLNGIQSVLKIQKASSQKELNNILEECQRNFDLGIATAPPIIRKISKNRWKVYQNMLNLGVSLQKVILKERDAEQNTAQSRKEINRAIQLCLLVNQLHAGDLSRLSHQPLCHCDIKPDNILVDSQGQLHLIDLGSTTTAMDNPCFDDFKGTVEYAPIDVHILHSGETNKHLILANGIFSILRLQDSGRNVPIITNAIQDRIAVLRVIAFPENETSDYPSILSRATQAQLPQSMRALLDTSVILPHIDGKRSNETCLFLAAAFILYQKMGDVITEQDLDHLRQNIALQRQLIQEEHVCLALVKDIPESLTAETKVLSEYEKAKDYFLKHPEKTKYSRKESGFSVSYLKDANGYVFSVANKQDARHDKGKGVSGRVKGTGESKVVKIQWIQSMKELQKVRQEAQINLDLGLASSELIERSFMRVDEQLVWKTYQEMYDGGERLTDYLKQASACVTEEEIIVQHKKDIDLSIRLCVLISRLHSGELSYSNTGYAHKDIKPDNLLIDSQGNLTLIDNGLATPDHSSPAIMGVFVGSLLYGPFDADLIVQAKTNIDAIQDSLLSLNRNPVLSSAKQDYIAMMRVLWLSVDLRQSERDKGVSIICQSTYSLLPKPLQELLNTQEISPFLSAERATESALFLAAVLISYRENNYQITTEAIQALRCASTEQLQEFICHYEKVLDKLNNSESIEMDNSEGGLSPDRGSERSLLSLSQRTLKDRLEILCHRSEEKVNEEAPTVGKR